MTLLDLEQHDPANPGSSAIATILRHDRKVTTYKIALIRALNEIVLTYSDRDVEAARGRSIIVPLRLIAERWIAYYWPFVSRAKPIPQGKPTNRDGVIRPDMSFRAALEELRWQWELAIGGAGKAADGYSLTGDFQLSRKREMFPPSLIAAHANAINAIVAAIRMPIRYAGPLGEEYTVFDLPDRAAVLAQSGAAAVPGTAPNDLSVVIRAPLWLAFRELSLYVEALCIHEWSLFTERLSRGLYERGAVYTMLTDRPDNRRPLSWERNQIEILMMEGHQFTCPWTRKTLFRADQYDLDHLIPVSVYPVNALWNLMPTNPYFNSHVKRDRLPSADRLAEAEDLLLASYRTYSASRQLGKALVDDASGYFAVPLEPEKQAAAITNATIAYINRVARARNVATF